MKRVCLFFGTLAVFAALAWVGGYNLDTRGFMVAYTSLVAIIFAYIITLMSDL